MEDNDKLRKQVERQVRRMQDAEKDKDTLLAQTIYLGTLGILFVLPVIVGAYLGLWLDEQYTRYSSVWTLAFTILGIVIGALNVYLFIRYK